MTCTTACSCSRLLHHFIGIVRRRPPPPLPILHAPLMHPPLITLSQAAPDLSQATPYPVPTLSLPPSCRRRHLSHMRLHASRSLPTLTTASTRTASERAVLRRGVSWRTSLIAGRGAARLAIISQVVRHRGQCALSARLSHGPVHPFRSALNGLVAPHQASGLRPAVMLCLYDKSEPSCTHNGQFDSESRQLFVMRRM